MMLLQTVLCLLLVLRPASAGKAGLAWNSGNSVDVNQYLTTGKVSWQVTPYVDRRIAYTIIMLF